MNRIFHARIVWYQYFLLVVLGINAFGFFSNVKNTRKQSNFYEDSDYNGRMCKYICYCIDSI